VPPLDRRLAIAPALPAFVGALLWGRAHGRAAAPSTGPAILSTTVSRAPAAAVAAPRVLVHVVGAVRRPAVYRLAATARVLDAVRAAGGAVRGADLEAIDLAAPLVDGEQVQVPRRGAAVAPAAAGAGGGAAGAPHAPVHLNGADAAALDGLPGIGPATAARIVAWRTAHGGFRRLDDLLDVPGIGPAKLAALKGLAVP
jgi:competence protein ComEA